MTRYKWLFMVGLLVLVLGLILDSVVDIRGVEFLAIILVGVVLVGISLIRLDFVRLIRDRHFLYAGNMIIIIGLIVVILGIVNYFSARRSCRIDASRNKYFSLSQQTVALLENLNIELEVLAFVRDVDQAQCEDLLAEYRYITPKFTFQVINPDRQPGLAEKYDVNQYGSVIVKSANHRERLSVLNEENLTNTIIKITREMTRKIAFVTGHGEADIHGADRNGFANAAAELKKQGYDVIELILAETDTIAADISVVVLAGPRKAFFPAELGKLTDYLQNGGSALFLLDPFPGTGLSEYMQNWNVITGNDLVVDASGFGRLLGAGPEIPLVSAYGDHPIVADLEGMMTFFPVTRSVQAIPAENPNIMVTEIAFSSLTSYAIKRGKSFNQNEISISPDDRRGPIPIACATSMKRANQAEVRIVTVGDSDFASNAYFTNQANGDFFMNSINWLAADEDLISIRPKSPDIRALNMTPVQMRIVFLIVVVILPALAVALGILTYRRKQ